MSLLTTLRAPSTGRRPAKPAGRHTARAHQATAREHNLLQQLAGAEQLIEGLRMQLAEEQQGHAETSRRLEVAIRANRANAEAETVQTDVTALRAATADAFVDSPAPGPQYRPYRRITGRTIRVVPLWEAPFATVNPGAIPGVVR